MRTVNRKSPKFDAVRVQNNSLRRQTITMYGWLLTEITFP